MEFVTAKISGLEELQATLEALPRNVAQKGVRKALQAGAAPVKQSMVELAPKDSGFLSEHIGTRTKMLAGDVGGKIDIGPEGKVKYPDGQHMSAVKVASLNEFGHQTRGPEGQNLHGKESSDRKRVAANPFLTRAWELRKNDALQAIIDTLRIEIIASLVQKAMGSTK